MPSGDLSNTFCGDAEYCGDTLYAGDSSTTEYGLLAFADGDSASLLDGEPSSIALGDTRYNGVDFAAGEPW